MPKLLSPPEVDEWRPKPWRVKSVSQGKWAYLCYVWPTVPRVLPTPRIARGVGRWVPSKSEAVARRVGEKFSCDAIWAFPRRLTTPAGMAALKNLPQEEW